MDNLHLNAKCLQGLAMSMQRGCIDIVSLLVEEAFAPVRRFKLHGPVHAKNQLWWRGELREMLPEGVHPSARPTGNEEQTPSQLAWINLLNKPPKTVSPTMAVMARPDNLCEGAVHGIGDRIATVTRRSWPLEQWNSRCNG